MKTSHFMIIFVLFFLLFAGTVKAQVVVGDLTGKSAIGYRLGIVNEDENVIQEDLDFSHSVAFTHMLSRNFALEVEGSYLRGDHDGTAYAIFSDVLFKYPIDWIALYVRGGLGLQHTRNVTDMFSNLDDSISTRVGGGIEYFIKSDVAIDTESLFVFSGDDAPDSWQFRTGIKYYF